MREKRAGREQAQKFGFSGDTGETAGPGEKGPCPSVRAWPFDGKDYFDIHSAASLSLHST